MTIFKLDHYDVLVQDDDGKPVAHEVTVYHPDKLYAETQAPKYGLTVTMDADGNPDISSVLGQHLQTLEVWAVLKRSGKYAKPFANFKNTDCLAIQEAAAVELDPTQPEGGTPSPSPSAKSGPRSRSGSTPKSTND